MKRTINRKGYSGRWLRGSFGQFLAYFLAIILMQIVSQWQIKVIVLILLLVGFYKHIEQDYEMVKILTKQLENDNEL